MSTEFSASGSRVPVIRPMTPADLDAVLAIERQSSPDPWTPGILHDELHGEARHYLVAAAANGAVIGFSGMLAQVGEGHVTNIAVDPLFRSRRVAARLLLPSMRWALRQEVGALTLEVRVGNDPAIRLYRRFGFAPVGTRPKYYANGDDALILWAHDVDSADYGFRLATIETWLATPRLDSLEDHAAAVGASPAGSSENA